MRCLTYVLKRFWKEGGYIVIRRSHWSRLFPHFLYMKKEGAELEHFVPDKPKTRWLAPLSYKGKIVKGDKEIKEMITELGNAFRGLWQSYYCDWEHSNIFYNKWTVTFIDKGQYVETPNCDTPEDALKFAVERLKK